jgi:hypothetical protein
MWQNVGCCPRVCADGGLGQADRSDGRVWIGIDAMNSRIG